MPLTVMANSRPFRQPHTPHTRSNFVRTLYLHANVGNLGIPLSWLFTDRLSANRVEQLAKDLQACALMTRRQDAISFHSYRATAASGYKVTVLGRGTSFAKTTDYLASGSTNANFVKITIDETYGSINNFWEGMEVDIVANSGGSASVAGTLTDGVNTNGSDIRNYTSGAVYVQCFVTKVNRKTMEVTVIGVTRSTTDGITTYSDTTGWQGTTGDRGLRLDLPRGASIYIAGQRPWLTNGLEDWMAATGTIMGGATGSDGLDVDNGRCSSPCEFPGRTAHRGLPRHDMALFNSLFPQIKLTDIITRTGILLKYKETLKTVVFSSSGTAPICRSKSEALDPGQLHNPNGRSAVVDFALLPEGPGLLPAVRRREPEALLQYILGQTSRIFAEGIQFLGPLLDGNHQGPRDRNQWDHKVHHGHAPSSGLPCCAPSCPTA